ncbi:MAG: hypothetical protein L3J41_00770 [Melioribacteraceae bacterium]|nr:hypothetical protein [Melioribacteraceae bacterium]
MTKKIILAFLIFISITSIQAQVDVAGGMGISFVASPSLNDYLNYNISSSKDLGTFNSTVEFYGEVDYSISEKYQIGFEYVYALFGYSTLLTGLNYKLDYEHHKPSVLGYYVISGKGYKFKFGGGVGARIINLSEQKTIVDDYSTTGFGILGRIQGHTTLGGNFYANVGSTIRYDAPGEPANGELKLNDTITNESVNINSFSVSVNIGFSYFF